MLSIPLPITTGMWKTRLESLMLSGVIGGPTPTPGPGAQVIFHVDLVSCAEQGYGVALGHTSSERMRERLEWAVCFLRVYPSDLQSLCPAQDCFFASVAESEHPLFSGKPLVWRMDHRRDGNQLIHWRDLRRACEYIAVVPFDLMKM